MMGSIIPRYQLRRFDTGSSVSAWSDYGPEDQAAAGHTTLSPAPPPPVRAMSPAYLPPRHERVVPGRNDSTTSTLSEFSNLEANFLPIQNIASGAISEVSIPAAVTRGITPPPPPPTACVNANDNHHRRVAVNALGQFVGSESILTSEMEMTENMEILVNGGVYTLHADNFFRPTKENILQPNSKYHGYAFKGNDAIFRPLRGTKAALDASTLCLVTPAAADHEVNGKVLHRIGKVTSPHVIDNDAYYTFDPILGGFLRTRINGGSSAAQLINGSTSSSSKQTTSMKQTMGSTLETSYSAGTEENSDQREQKEEEQKRNGSSHRASPNKSLGEPPSRIDLKAALETIPPHEPPLPTSCRTPVRRHSVDSLPILPLLPLMKESTATLTTILLRLPGPRLSPILLPADDKTLFKALHAEYVGSQSVLRRLLSFQRLQGITVIQYTSIRELTSSSSSIRCATYRNEHITLATGVLALLARGVATNGRSSCIGRPDKLLTGDHHHHHHHHHHHDTRCVEFLTRSASAAAREDRRIGIEFCMGLSWKRVLVAGTAIGLTAVAGAVCWCLFGPGSEASRYIAAFVLGIFLLSLGTGAALVINRVTS